jgi:hypothetical protein
MGGAAGFGGGGGGGGGAGFTGNAQTGGAGGAAPGEFGGTGGSGTGRGSHIGVGGGGGGGAGLGGGIFSNGGAVTLVNDTFTANSADGGVGGVSGGDAGADGSGYGGALFAVNGTVYAAYNTFSANLAHNHADTALDGTDIYVMADATDTGVHGSGNTTTLIDDILGQTTATTSDFVANAISFAQMPVMGGSHDLLSNNSPSTGLLIPANAYTGTNLVSGNPKLGPLAFNAGPTATMALLTGSPAIGQGITAYYDYPGTSEEITTDQRGQTRTGGLDLGAFQIVAPTVYTVTDSGDGAGGAGDVTLRYAIDQAVALEQVASIVFSPSLSGTSITLSHISSSPTNVYGHTEFVLTGTVITIDGTDAPGLVISGGSALRPFVVEVSAHGPTLVTTLIPSNARR